MNGVPLLGLNHVAPDNPDSEETWLDKKGKIKQHIYGRGYRVPAYVVLYLSGVKAN